MSDKSTPYGWRDFDQAVVTALVEQQLDHLDKSPQGGMTCPLRSHHEERLTWVDGDYTKGTIPRFEPAVSFRISPTYILSDRRDNFIAGTDIIDRLLDSPGKAETHRLGHEQSEDTPSLASLRTYLDNKSYSLRPALNLLRQDAESTRQLQ
jgi:hypothetical protein